MADFESSVGERRVEAREVASGSSYYWDAAEAAFYMLYAYAKGVRDDLTPEQLKLLRQAVREEFR